MTNINIYFLLQTVKRAFHRKPTYGPSDENKRESWNQFRQAAKLTRQTKRKNWFYHIIIVLFRGYRYNKV